MLLRLKAFAQGAAAAAQLPATELIGAKEGPDAMACRDGLSIVVGAEVFAVHETGSTTRSSSIRAWAVVEAHRSKWSDRRGELVVRLVQEFRG